MLVTMMKPFRSFSGIMDELVYAGYNEGYICYSRDYVIPRATANNEKVGSIATNLGVVYDSFDSGWVDDLKEYSYRYATDVQTKRDRHPSFYSLFGKMWWAVAKDDPTIDLKTVTFADIALLDIGIKTIKGAIDNGFLPKVHKIDDLINTYDGV